jgi:hypothetical protein
VILHQLPHHVPTPVVQEVFQLGCREHGRSGVGELTIDYALFLDDPDFAMRCRCGSAACRRVVKGTDWMRPELRQRYRGWFSWWLQQEIARDQGGASVKGSS